MEMECPICGVEGEFALLCEDCIREQDAAKVLQAQIKKAKKNLYNLQQKHIRLTGVQYFG